ncbi:MAG: glycosyltransferase [Nanoarchaeota archaeon]|nr:glycosyltransferase [Nanoarchaeota archaeon]
MKILFVSNSTTHDYNKTPIIGRPSAWNFLPYYLKKQDADVEVLGVGKYELYKTYFMYLKFKPDLIITTWIPACFVPIFLKKIGLIKCPIIHRWEDYYEEMMTNYPRLLTGFMERFSAKNADYIITVLKTNEEKAKKMNKQVFLLPFGLIAGLGKTKINLDKLKTKRSNLKVIYSGTQEEWKRVDKIINAAKKVDCDLFLIGDTNPKLKALAEGYKNIHFMGYLPSNELLSILKQGDILVNTANHDMCMKFIDYIAAGKVILAYDGRSNNFLKNRENAYLTKDFTEGLKELIKNKELRKKLGNNVKKIKLYTHEEVADIHLKLYKKILAGDKNLKEFEKSYFHIQYLDD